MNNDSHGPLYHAQFRRCFMVVHVPVPKPFIQTLLYIGPSYPSAKMVSADIVS